MSSCVLSPSLRACACGCLCVCVCVCESAMCYVQLLPETSQNEIHPNTANTNTILGKIATQTSCNSNETISSQNLRPGKKVPESSMESSRCSSPSAPVQVGVLQSCCPSGSCPPVPWSASVPMLVHLFLSNTNKLLHFLEGGECKGGFIFFTCGVSHCW